MKYSNQLVIAQKQELLANQKNATQISSTTNYTNTLPSNTNTSSQTSGNKVSMISTGDEGYSFQPETIQVKTGETVTWTNSDNALHTVTSGSGTDENMGAEFDSGFMSSGESFQHLFNTAGQFPYFCAVHPEMIGEVIVS